MIVIQRKTGLILHADPVKPEKRQAWWEDYIAKAAPEALKELMEQKGGEPNG